MHEIATFPARAPIGTDAEGRPVVGSRELLAHISQMYLRAGGAVAPTNGELGEMADAQDQIAAPDYGPRIAELAKAIDAIDPFTPAVPQAAQETPAFADAAPTDPRLFSRLSDIETMQAFV